MTQTILVTGASGFIAKHIVLQLLQAGHDVVGSVRKLDRGEEVRAAMRAHLPEGFDLEGKLRFVALDLDRDAGWAEAMAGVDAVMHTASPFPLNDPKSEDEVIRPAVDGARRALAAAHAAGIERVILTSSAYAVMYREPDPAKPVMDEEDWSDPAHPTVNVYGRSKIMAERAAWAFVADEAPGMALTVINPVLVVGPPLDRNFGTSIGIVERIMQAKDPFLPGIGIPLVDVRDVAAMHLAALARPQTAGRRYLATAPGFLWFRQMAQTLKEAFPDRRIVTRQAPEWLIRVLALVVRDLRGVVPSLGREMKVTGRRAETEMDIAFRPARESLVDAARFLVDQRLV